MGRDTGLAPLLDWSGERAKVLARVPAGLAQQEDGDQVFLDLVVGDRSDQTMRFTFQLFEQTPLAFANFMALCKHSVHGLGEAGHPLTLKRSRVTKIVKGSFAEAGDFTLGDGRGGDSIYGAEGFEPEAFGLRLKHDAAGLLTMVPRQGKDFCQSKFRITLGAMPSLDEGCVVIGRLVSGAMHLPTLENIPVDASNRPVRSVTIVDAGQVPGFSTLPPPMPMAAASTTAATAADVAASADALRGSVASAVQAALQQQAGAGGSSSTATADADIAATGGGKKRSAEAPPPPAAKRAAHWDALACGLDMGEEDDDEDEEDS